ncbi:hypothetical protein FHS85_001866 [Rhodoligotrophos appendicifer]|uniref:DUF2793 domain-containing protein n=1 Tax=Rhodoligotrophos appendicifer TaxID=987056 RepID=UPI00118704BC|nr:DUF2793 domain-containing protein [Rhodoligotrophos appendicifer]
MSESEHLRLPYLEAAQAQKHVTVNDALDRLDTLVQLAVLDRDLTAPPGSPGEGDRYLIAPGATGLWSGHGNEIAAFQAGAWMFHAPQEGWLAWVADETLALVWDGAAWGGLPISAAALQDIALLGIGTVADGSTPLAAKLNAALFTAKTVSEGGDGDLRYTMNKESAADTASLLFQSGYSGRAELGLTGDDDLHLKVSSDGSSWHDALSVDRGSGALAIASGFTGAHALSRQWPALAAGTLAIDYADGQHAEATLTANVAVLSVTNWPASGGQLLLVVKQDATGGRSFAWPSAWQAAGGSKPVVSSGAHEKDRYLLTYDGADVVIDVLGQAYG